MESKASKKESTASAKHWSSNEIRHHLRLRHQYLHHDYWSHLRQTLVHSIMNTKYCPRCKKDLPTNCYNRSSSSNDGLFFYCRHCARSKAQIYKNNRKYAKHKLLNTNSPSEFVELLAAIKINDVVHKVAKQYIIDHPEVYEDITRILLR